MWLKKPPMQDDSHDADERRDRSNSRQQIANFSYPRSDFVHYYPKQLSTVRNSQGSDSSPPQLVEDHGSDFSYEDDSQLRALEASSWGCWHARTQQGAKSDHPALVDSAVSRQAAARGPTLACGDSSPTTRSPADLGSQTDEPSRRVAASSQEQQDEKRNNRAKTRLFEGLNTLLKAWGLQRGNLVGFNSAATSESRVKSAALPLDWVLFRELRLLLNRLRILSTNSGPLAPAAIYHDRPLPPLPAERPSSPPHISVFETDSDDEDGEGNDWPLSVAETTKSLARRFMHGLVHHSHSRHHHHHHHQSCDGREKGFKQCPSHKRSVSDEGPATPASPTKNKGSESADGGGARIAVARKRNAAAGSRKAGTAAEAKAAASRGAMSMDLPRDSTSPRGRVEADGGQKTGRRRVDFFWGRILRRKGED
ncbi:hypothetical protein VTH06DRAFT_4478 [Thermothelomyces fergusii]